MFNGTTIAPVSYAKLKRDTQRNADKLTLVGIDELGQAKVVLDNGKRYGGVTQDGGFIMCVVVFLLSQL